MSRTLCRMKKFGWAAASGAAIARIATRVGYETTMGFQRCSVYTTVYPLAVIGHARALHEKSPSALSRELHTRAPVHRLGVLDQRELQDHYSASRDSDICKLSPQLKFGLDTLY
jgi:hypothetical protein